MTKSCWSTEFKDWLAHKMQECGESNYALAKQLGVSQSTIANWLSGATKPFRPYALILESHYGEPPAGLSVAEN
jgi:predicted transcriptional regulator